MHDQSPCEIKRDIIPFLGAVYEEGNASLIFAMTHTHSAQLIRTVLEGQWYSYIASSRLN